MAQQGRSDDFVTLQELGVSNASEIAALVAVLEREGTLTQAELLDEVRRLKGAGAKAK